MIAGCGVDLRQSIKKETNSFAEEDEDSNDDFDDYENWDDDDDDDWDGLDGEGAVEECPPGQFFCGHPQSSGSLKRPIRICWFIAHCYVAQLIS